MRSSQEKAGNTFNLFIHPIFYLRYFCLFLLIQRENSTHFFHSSNPRRQAKGQLT